VWRGAAQKTTMRAEPIAPAREFTLHPYAPPKRWGRFRNQTSGGLFELKLFGFDDEISRPCSCALRTTSATASVATIARQNLSVASLAYQ